jgi:hypothetical protein
LEEDIKKEILEEGLEEILEEGLKDLEKTIQVLKSQKNKNRSRPKMSKQL